MQTVCTHSLPRRERTPFVPGTVVLSVRTKCVPYLKPQASRSPHPLHLLQELRVEAVDVGAEGGLEFLDARGRLVPE